MTANCRAFFVVVFLIGCRGASDLASTENGLEGIVRRGPIAPVCMVNVPCDAPFSATFAVRDERRVVAQFRSDATGHFLVMLPAGHYVVTPDATAPLLGAAQQSRAVVVGSVGVTRIDLNFDTGIR